MVIVGAGSRGTTYAACATKAGARVVAVAEPRPAAQKAFVDAHDVPPDAVFDDWRDLLDKPRLADIAVIATQDRSHVDPAAELARRGYHLLLEKPMATSEADCERIVRAAEDAGVMLAVCHVLRYTRYSRVLKHVVYSGRIGDVVSVDLPEGADGQRQQLIQQAQTKSDSYDVITIDLPWNAEFAARRWVTELSPVEFDVDGFFDAPLKGSEYRGKLYSIPNSVPDEATFLRIVGT
ncbi:Gfo/Idh/MocA family protein [Kibdelosporangium banguiense]|nr:Gfo/Idh/MocA family oxidoreductase [Kibdelosporangium banguiense]